MSAYSISSRYAVALFELAAEGVKIADDLNKLVVLSENADVMKFLALPSCSVEQKVHVIEKAVGLTAEGQRFLALLCEREKSALIPMIGEQFDALVRKANAQIEVTARVAVAVESKLVKELKSSVESLLGQGVLLSVVEDAQVIGGVVLEVGDRQIDCSIRGKLDAMRRSLAL
ncbi:MAG: ATP synthase F1 subunit delta [Zetaproteobacteria bacterium]|nr:ATP synthase F1 subunit delta [Zetaproteobacteria bacterium]